MTGGVVPPAVSEFLTRWVRLARSRNEADGWSLPEDSEPEPWCWLAMPPLSPPITARAAQP